MPINRVHCLSIMIGVALLFSSCTKEGSDTTEKRDVQDQGQGIAVFVNVIKRGKLVNFQNTSIGNAFDSYQYLKNKQWRAEQLKSRHITVDFTGWFDPDGSKDSDTGKDAASRGLEAKFVINPDGAYYLFMISVLDLKSDGTVSRTQMPDTAAVLAAIYGNKKIKL